MSIASLSSVLISTMRGASARVSWDDSQAAPFELWGTENMPCVVAWKTGSFEKRGPKPLLIPVEAAHRNGIIPTRLWNWNGDERPRWPV